MSVAGFAVIDCHHHVGSLDAQGFKVPGMAADADPAEVELTRRFDAMARHGIDQAIVIPGHGYIRPGGIADTRRVNDAIATYRDAHPDRFPAALGIVEPLHGSASREELRRMRDELDLVGVSIHARFQGVATDSPLVLSLMREAADLGLVPFIHAVDGVPDEALWRVQQVARAVPDTTIVVLDALSGPEHARQAAVIGADTPNLVFDTSLCHHHLFVDALLAAVGADRVVFGTDYYSLMAPPLHIGVLADLLASPLSDAEKQAILAENLQRILGLTKPDTDGRVNASRSKG